MKIPLSKVFLTLIHTSTDKRGPDTCRTDDAKAICGGHSLPDICHSISGPQGGKVGGSECTKSSSGGLEHVKLILIESTTPEPES